VFKVLYHSVKFGGARISRAAKNVRTIVCDVGVLWPNGWADQDETWQVGMQAGLGPGHIVLGGDPAPPPQRGIASPNFWPISVAAKWLHGSRCHSAWS